MVADDGLQLAHLLAAVTVNIACHLALARMRRHANVVTVLLSAYAAGMAVLLVLQHGGATTIAAAALTYSAISYCYFHYVHIGASSVRIQILRELEACPGGIRPEALLDRYGARHILQLRLDRMLGNGQIVERGGRYHTGKPRMLYVAKVFAVLKRIIMGRKISHTLHR